MVMTNSGKSGTALLWSVSGTRPDYIAIGSGSGAVAATNTNLIAEVFGAAFTSTTITTAQQVTFISDFTSTQMSGINLKEFGLKVSGLSNATWNREGFAGITFTGSAESQIEITLQTF